MQIQTTRSTTTIDKEVGGIASSTYAIVERAAECRSDNAISSSSLDIGVDYRAELVVRSCVTPVFERVVDVVVKKRHPGVYQGYGGDGDKSNECKPEGRASSGSSRRQTRVGQARQRAGGHCVGAACSTGSISGTQKTAFQELCYVGSAAGQTTSGHRSSASTPSHVVSPAQASLNKAVYSQGHSGPTSTFKISKGYYMLFMFYSFFTMPIGTCGASISSGAVGSTTSKMIHTWQDQATLKASLAGSSSNWHFGLGTARVHAMKHLRVVTLNVGGSLHLRDNCTILAREIEQLECDIVIITETQLGTAGHKHIQRGMEQALEATGIGVMSEYSFISSACAPDYHAAGQGIILCIRKDLIADEIEVIVPGRLLIVTLKANGSNRKINIAALYFPAAGGSTKAGKREAAEILASLQTLKRKRAGKWILAGDLNAVGHPSDRLSARLTRYDKNGPPSVLETAGWKDTWKMKHRGVMNARGVCSWTRLIQPEACQAPIHAARIDAIWVSGGSFNTLKRTCIDMGRILFTAAALDHRQ